MRYFVYADSVMLDSLYAQLNCGLLRFWSAEKQKGASKSQNDSQNVNGNLCNDDENPGLSATNSQTQFREHRHRRFEDKILYDYAFTEIYTHLRQQNALQLTAPFIPGTYCEITADANFIAMELPLDMEDEAAQNAAVQAMPDVAPSSYYNRGLYTWRWQKIWSAKRLLLLDNFLFVLDLTQLRDNPDVLQFQYGGKVTGVGLLSNSFEIAIAPEKYTEYLQVIRPYLHPSYKMLHIVRPMAVFYEFC